jgi:hypothetical protein
MIQLVFAVFDTASESFARPVFVGARGQAIRAFADEVNRAAPDNQMNAHPKDFALYYLGDYDDVTGALSPRDPRPELVVRGTDFFVVPEGR